MVSHLETREKFGPRNPEVVEEPKQIEEQNPYMWDVFLQVYTSIYIYIYVDKLHMHVSLTHMVYNTHLYIYIHK